MTLGDSCFTLTILTKRGPATEEGVECGAWGTGPCTGQVWGEKGRHGAARVHPVPRQTPEVTDLGCGLTGSDDVSPFAGRALPSPLLSSFITQSK